MSCRTRALLSQVDRHLRQLCGIVRGAERVTRKRGRRLRSLMSSVSRRAGAPVTGLGLVGSAVLAEPLARRGHGRFLRTANARLSGLSFLVRKVIGASHLRANIVALRGRSTIVKSALIDTVGNILTPVRRGRVDLSISYPSSLAVSRSDH